MNNVSARLVVAGNAYFAGADMGDGDLTAGTLELRGNFLTQSNYYQAFRATGTHVTKFNGTTAQSISIYYPADDKTRFQNVEFANSSTSGVSLATNMVVGGNVAQNGRLSVATVLHILAGLTLGPTSITNATGSIIYSSCSASPGASYSGFSCGGAAF